MKTGAISIINQEIKNHNQPVSNFEVTGCFLKLICLRNLIKDISWSEKIK